MSRATVIKASTIAPAAKLRLHSFQMEDVMREAEQAMAAAQVRAAELLREAEAQAIAIREAARAEGLCEGRDEGLRTGREEGRREAFETARAEFAAQQQNLVRALEKALADIAADRLAWKTAARQDLVDLALAIARRVVKHVGEREREAVLANLEEAVRLAGVRSEVTIAVNPRDAEAARLFTDSLLEMREQWEGVRIVEEPEVAPGGCRVQWSTGAVDATLDTQLARIEAELRGGPCDGAADGSEPGS